MKTAEEYKGISIRYWIDFDRGNINAKEYENRIESLFKQTQKEAYNQALDDASESATLSLFDWEDGGFVEHKRKENKFIINDGNYIEVDKDSILKLKK